MFKDFIWATSQKLPFHFSIGLVVSHVMILLYVLYYCNPYAKAMFRGDPLGCLFHRAVEMVVDRAGEQLQLNGTTITDPNTGPLVVSMSQLGCGELSKNYVSEPNPETLPVVVKRWHISRILQILTISMNILKSTIFPSSSCSWEFLNFGKAIKRHDGNLEVMESWIIKVVATILKRKDESFRKGVYIFYI